MKESNRDKTKREKGGENTEKNKIEGNKDWTKKRDKDKKIERIKQCARERKRVKRWVCRKTKIDKMFGRERSKTEIGERQSGTEWEIKEINERERKETVRKVRWTTLRERGNMFKIIYWRQKDLKWTYSYLL